MWRIVELSIWHLKDLTKKWSNHDPQEWRWFHHDLYLPEVVVIANYLIWSKQVNWLGERLVLFCVHQNGLGSETSYYNKCFVLHLLTKQCWGDGKFVALLWLGQEITKNIFHWWWSLSVGLGITQYNPRGKWKFYYMYI